MRTFVYAIQRGNKCAVAMRFTILCVLTLILGNNYSNANDQKPCIDIDKVIARAKRIKQASVRFDEMDLKRLEKELKIAAATPQCLFKSRSDSEAFALVKELSDLMGYFGNGNSSEPISLWESFLKQFPRSSHLDEAHWLRAKIAANPYEYEGYADAALQQIESIEGFIKRNPTNSHLADAELELARACRIAYETFRYGDGLSTNSKMNRKEAGRRYRDRARQLLLHLCDEASDRARADACLALRDLNKGQCVYIGPGSPNPHVPDRWAASNDER